MQMRSSPIKNLKLTKMSLPNCSPTYNRPYLSNSPQAKWSSILYKKHCLNIKTYKPYSPPTPKSIYKPSNPTSKPSATALTISEYFIAYLEGRKGRGKREVAEGAGTNRENAEGEGVAHPQAERAESTGDPASTPLLRHHHPENEAADRGKDSQ
jgi:hypothetical protein